MALTKVTGSVIKDSVSLSGNVSVGGTLTYQDVTNVDALGVGTFRTGINVSGGQLDVGSNIKIGNAGVITATNFSGSGASLTNLPAGNLTGTLPAISGANLTSLPAQATIANNGNDRIITGGSGVNLNGEANLQFDGTDLYVSDNIKHLGDPDTLIEFATDTITFDTAGSERLRIKSDGTILFTGKITNSSSFTSHNTNFYGGNVNTGGVRIEVAHSTTSVSGNTASASFPHHLLLSNYSGNGSADNRMCSIGFDIPTTSTHANAVIAYQATAAGTGDLQFHLESSNSISEKLRITSGGHISQGGGAEPSSSNGSVAKKFGIKSNANNVIIGETESSGNGSGLHIESRQTGRSGDARIAQIGMKNDASGDGQISFFTAPNGSGVVERMVIDSNGYVTKPNHPSFHARRVSNVSATQNPLVYDAVHHNNGSHYKSSGTDQGKFVAPVSGVYLFYWTAIKTSSGTVTRLYINVDGSHIYSNMHLRLQEQGNYSNGSMQAIVNLNAGQKVHISLEVGSIHGNEYTHFGGYLIH